MVSTHPPTSKYSSPFSNPLVTVPKAPITIGIIVTCMFHSFFNSLARTRYLSFFSHSFSFISLLLLLLLLLLYCICKLSINFSTTHHHHHVMPLAQIYIPDPLSPLLPIIHRLWQVFRATSRILTPRILTPRIYVRAGRPAFTLPYVGVHRSTSLMSSSLLLQQCPACLFRLTWIVFVMGGRWLHSWCLVGCCRQDLFNIARNILVSLPSSFFSSHYVSVQVVHPFSRIDTAAAWKKLRFILSIRSDFHMIDSLSIAVHAFVSRESMSFSVDETLLPR